MPLENDIKHQCISLRVDIGCVISTPAQQSSYQEGRTRIPLTSLPNHMLVPVLGQYLDVQRHMLWSLFVFSKLRREVIVDIGGIVSHYYS